jgi:hypothetical protein
LENCLNQSPPTIFSDESNKETTSLFIVKIRKKHEDEPGRVNNGGQIVDWEKMITR